MTAFSIITANALAHGGVVFLTSYGDWTGDIKDAATAAGEDETAVLLKIASAASNRTRVVEPYAIEVERTGETLSPVRLRERIRAAGPTVRPDLPKLDVHVASAAAAQE